MTGKRKIYRSIKKDTHIYLYTFFFENNNTKAKEKKNTMNKKN